MMTRKRWKLELPLHIMLIPGLILIAIFSYGPMVGVAIAFQNFNIGKGLFGSDWNGLDNFRYIYSLPTTLEVIRNTVFIAFGKIILGLIAPIITSLLLNELRKQFFKRSVQTLIYLPNFLSWVILSGILIEILSPSTGIVNDFIKWLGLKPVFFLGNAEWFPWVMIVTDTWKEFGFNTIVYLAALTAINPALYEAAVIDGASHWKRMLYVTLPGMLPIIILLTTLSLGQVLNAGFDQIFNLYNPTVYETGDILDTYVYRIGLGNGQFGVATAVGLFKSVISLFMISLSYYLAVRYANYRIF